MHAKSLEEIASIAAGIDRGYVIARAVELVERCMSREPVKGTDGGVWQFDSSGAARGLELIGKSLGMFSERLRLGIGPDLQSIPDAELESVIDRLKAVSGGVVLSLPSAVRDVVGHSSASYSGDIDIIPAALAEQDAIATLAAREQGATVGPERSLEVEPSLPAGQQGVSLLPELAPVKVRPVKAREVAAIGTAPTFSLRPPSASEILGLLKPSPVGDAGAEGALASEREGEGERPQL
jgi:hypothetical protein